ncbi:hypothetical protein VTK73DRAFT_6924 [Phialemonium thermophilum]|uniref:Uncharacterized protein n=1 Tax=Phialemonium thermophilum TaxID=223376 RepID=A0ABR3WHL7_9PEZI
MPEQSRLFDGSPPPRLLLSVGAEPGGTKGAATNAVRVRTTGTNLMSNVYQVHAPSRVRWYGISTGLG